MHNPFLKHIYDIIDENLGREEFNVEDLARLANLSRSTLHRRIKNLTGKSASELITWKRIKRAMELLQNDSGTVSEIAFMVGFSDPSYFNKIFKKYYKISPGKVRTSEFRKIDFKELKNDFHSKARPVTLLIRAPRKLILYIGIIMLFISGITLIAINLRPEKETSIAVLPLLNHTGIPENESFIDGLHDALIGELGKISSLRVISATSTRQFRNSEALLPEIAEQLGVNTIVEGSVTSIDDSLRLIIQLIDVYSEEKHLFTGDYKDGIQNVLALQKKVTKDIARHTRTRMKEMEELNLERSDIVDPLSYKSYLRSMFYINQGTVESVQRGIDTLASIIMRDPGDEFALAGYALGKALQGHGSNLAREYFRSATVAANRATTIDRNNVVANTALALLYLYQFWDWDNARKAFEQALESNPNNDIAHAHFAWYHVLFSNHSEAIYHAHQAVLIDPLSATYKSWLAWLYFNIKEYDNAEFWARESIRLNDEIPWGNLVLGWVQLEKGNNMEAIEAHEKLPREAIHWKWFLCRTYFLAGESDKAEKIFSDLKDEKNKNWINPFYLGMTAGVLGHSDQAFQLLKEACEKRYYPVEYIMSFPSAEFIIEDPRFRSLLTLMELPDPFLKFAKEHGNN